MRKRDYGQIIAGSLKGRKIQFSLSKTLRPTRRMMREALFSALFSRLGDFDGLRVLDGFCGSGLIGLEFISRGASFVDFVDHDTDNFRQFRENIAPFNEAIQDNFRYWHGKVSWMIAQGDEDSTWDVVWFDPPFDTVPRQEIVDLLEAKRCRVFVIHFSKEKKQTYRNIFDQTSELYGCVYEREFGASSVVILVKNS